MDALVYGRWVVQPSSIQTRMPIWMPSFTNVHDLDITSLHSHFSFQWLPSHVLFVRSPVSLRENLIPRDTHSLAHFLSPAIRFQDGLALIFFFNYPLEFVYGSSSSSFSLESIISGLVIFCFLPWFSCYFHFCIEICIFIVAWVGVCFGASGPTSRASYLTLLGVGLTGR